MGTTLLIIMVHGISLMSPLAPSRDKADGVQLAVRDGETLQRSAGASSTLLTPL